MALPREMMKRFIHRKKSTIYLLLSANARFKEHDGAWSPCVIYCPDDDENTIYVRRTADFDLNFDEVGVEEMDMVKLAAELKSDEGLRLKPYRCTAGKWTIGYGHMLGDDLPRVYANGISHAQAESLFARDIEQAIRDARNFAANAWNGLSDNRRRVVVNMAFQLGLSRLLGFRRFRAALWLHDYQAAAKEMLDSLWARQTPNRARRLHARMLEG